MYTAVVLDKKSKDDLKNATNHLLKKGFESEVNGVQLPHHMTINLGEFDERLNDPDILGMYAILRAEALWWDHKVCCVEITEAHATHIENDSIIDLIPINTLNDDEYCAHVTMGVKNGGRPRDSKYLFTSKNSCDADINPITLLGEIKIVH